MSAPTLFRTTSVPEQGRSVTSPWLAKMASTAWQNPLPTVILTPNRAEGFYLRSRLVAEGTPFFGLRFWTPSDARQFLRGKLATELDPVTQSELRLIARTSAERLLSDNPNGTLRSVAQDPGPFLRAYDLLLGAGWEPAQAGAVYGRELAAALERNLQSQRLATQAGLHRHLREKARSQKEPLIANLLIVGFNALHWPLWDLLQAIVFSADHTTIALTEPRTFGQTSDQLWLSSWEEITNQEALVPEGTAEEEAPAPFDSLVESYEKGAPVPIETENLDFLVTPDLASQSQAIVLQVIAHLQRDECTRLGIVFAEANALALAVAEELRRLEIPLDDGTGSLKPGLFERRAWQTWLALQNEPSVQTLISWLRACEAQKVSFGLDDASLSARDAADTVDKTLGETLVDDLNFLGRCLEENADRPRELTVARLLRERITLPESAPFTTYIDTTRRFLALPGWEAYAARLEIDPPAWLLTDPRSISKRAFLAWLEEALDSQERVRGPNGNHFYGKVHLLAYGQLGGQAWSHLILTGLNEGVWPRLSIAEAFGSRHELAALNAQAKALNRRSLAQGRQGEGHEVIREGHGYCLLPLDRQDLALRDLCSALEATTESVCLTAMTTEAGRSLLPSDFFTHAYQSQTGNPLDDATFNHLAKITLAWCQKQSAILSPAPSRENNASILATREAYEARRDSTQPFGPCEFAYGEPPARPIQLSCKTWETAWNHPSSVWLTEVIGVSPWSEGTLSWSRAVGTWVHRWLTLVLHESDKRNFTESFPHLLQDAATRETARVRLHAQAAGLELYPWWEQVWGQARSLALALGESLLPQITGQRLLSEYKLPPGIVIALPGQPQSDFALTGRLDLALIETGSVPCDPANGNFTGCTAWVVDFKTGSADKLVVKKIEQGQGIQPLLYALALRARGATAVTLSLHTPDTPLVRQVDLSVFTGEEELFRSLDLMHRRGILGMRPDAGNDYGYSPAYPMATRFIASAILEAKWALVHGGEEKEDAS